VPGRPPFAWEERPALGRVPEDAAKDRAYAIVGGIFLVSGFVLQAFGYLGVSVDASTTAKLLAAVIAICVGKLAALALYGVAYTWQVQRLDAQARERWPDIDAGQLRRAPRGRAMGRRCSRGLSKYVDLKLVSRLEFGSGAVAMRYEPRR
jgi:hypothetical protein